MRAPIVLVTLFALAGVAAAQARTSATGFDHIVHDGRITVVGKPSLACTACHPVTPAGVLVGRPGHKACLGSCHVWAPRPGVALTLAEELEQVCTTCHAQADLGTPKPAVPYPPYQIEPDFPMTISHAKHASARCELCHATPGARATAPAARPAPTARPHARCIGCHPAGAPPPIPAVATALPASGPAPMAACTSCHVAAYGANALPRLVRGPLAVGAAGYSHTRHASRAPASAVACATCHVSITAATGLELTPPTAAQCATAGCHDAKIAFAITERCTSCHTSPPKTRAEIARPAARFAHDAHASRLPLDNCAACHALDSRGEPAVSGHAACASCHAGDFGKREPTTCGACHASTEPWRALIADRLPAPRSELGARMNHAAHATLDCARCHTLTTATRELRPPRGHGACTGSGCHTRTKTAGAPAPTLDACATCHALGLERARVEERTGAAWSVRARFRHDVHAAETCTTCHDGVAASTDAATLRSPKKPACAPCHDGKRAFKMTGHGCARCHGS
ncbi:MAG TPA: cytochrome c3 family protein [Kofleriaceae bacterium]|nr:cytochrome c3 family protein [Kofleriaceae bacterium]